MLSRPENVVYFFRNVLQKPCITKQILGTRTKDYNNWVDSYSRNKGIPLECAQKSVRKEDYVHPELKAMEQKNQTGVYFILKSMEQGSTFRSVKPKYATNDPSHRIIKKARSLFTHYYFHIRDAIAGPMLIRVGSYLPFQTTCYLNGHNFIEQQLLRTGIRYKKNDNSIVSVEDPVLLQAVTDNLSHKAILPKSSKRERQKMDLRRFYAISQIEYCQNFIFRRNFSIRKLFERSCELSFFLMTADKISNMFGWHITRKFRRKPSNHRR